MCHFLNSKGLLLTSHKSQKITRCHEWQRKTGCQLIKFNELQGVTDNNVLQFVIGDNEPKSVIGDHESQGVIDDITGYPSR